VHELKHDGYRLQIHVRDGRVRLYTITGADWSKRYPLIVEAAARIDGSAILDAEVVWLGLDGVPDFDALHSRVNDRSAVALAFDLMSLDGEDFRHEPFSERKAVLAKFSGEAVEVFNTSNTPKATAWKCSKPSASLA
jgi:bifunctional non-homologous end joining protein LigD